MSLALQVGSLLLAPPGSLGNPVSNIKYIFFFRCLCSNLQISELNDYGSNLQVKKEKDSTRWCQNYSLVTFERSIDPGALDRTQLLAILNVKQWKMWCICDPRGRKNGFSAFLEKMDRRLTGRRWSLSHVRLFVTTRTVAHQAPLSMRFSKRECWSGLPFPSPGDLPNPGTKTGSPTLQADSLPSEPPGKP